MHRTSSLHQSSEYCHLCRCCIRMYRRRMRYSSKSMRRCGTQLLSLWYASLQHVLPCFRLGLGWSRTHLSHVPSTSAAPGGWDGPLSEAIVESLQGETLIRGTEDIHQSWQSHKDPRPILKRPWQLRSDTGRACCLIWRAGIIASSLRVQGGVKLEIAGSVLLLISWPCLVRGAAGFFFFVFHLIISA